MANSDATTHTANPLQVLLSLPLDGKSDFLDLAPVCSELVAALLETTSETARLAYSGRLAMALSLLRDCLDTPLTQKQREALTRESSITAAPHTEFSPESETLCEYCCALNSVLLSRTLTESVENIIAGLLFDLVNHLSDSLTAPRFYRSPEGLRDIETGDIIGGGL